MRIDWENIRGLDSRSFKCGNCGSDIAADKGYSGNAKDKGMVYLYKCHKCGLMTFFNYDGKQIPGKMFGNPIEGIDKDEVKKLYEEARKCYSSNAFTAAVMCCRKLLMNIAVSKKAKEGQSFASYVDYLVEHGFVPPDGAEWVKHIKDKGNDANHKIDIMESTDAEEILIFIENLLRFIYELPNRMKKVEKKPDEKKE